ncbi:MAG: arylesterase [Bacteroidetes bacterium]|nr:arylesterase [Bacteroidota bacterium]
MVSNSHDFALRSALKDRKTLLYPTLCLVVLLSACSSDKSQETPQDLATSDATSTPESNQQGATLGTTASDSAIRVVFLGDSITAGAGVGQEEAFPYLVSEMAKKEGLDAIFIDGGVSGDTSTGGLNRIDWLLKNRVDVLVLELGGNDGLRGVDLTLTQENLSNIIRKTKQTWPEAEIVVAGMQVHTNIGHEYTAQFKTMFPRLAKEHDAALIPFILEGVGGVKELNQPDGIHPTPKGHQIVAETVWKTLQPILLAKSQR